MYLQHQVFGEDDLYNGRPTIMSILEDGFLRRSKETKNYKMAGEEDKETHKYIYLQINLRKNESQRTFTLNMDLLLEQTFWLNIGWKGKKTDSSIRVNGTKLTKEELDTIMCEFRKTVKRNIKERKNNRPMGSLMTHEILLKKPIDLHRFLHRINCNKLDKDHVNYIKENYENVELQVADE